ncbi:MAG TPA: cation-translocating P-type ATPase, partial [Actinomycetaceae bacterium]|nr:cation-translocating P-type ATPase [Actinomycetaceae bacterium]
AIEEAGYTCPTPTAATEGTDHGAQTDRAAALTRRAMTLMGLIFAVVLFVVVIGEGMGLVDALTYRVPFWIGALLVIACGLPVFRNVLRNALRGRIVSHTLMSTGALAALAIGEWATAALVVFFMRVGDYAESFTIERARRSLKDLTALAPKTARVERDGSDSEIPIEQVRLGDIVVVRPGDIIPVDGEVVSGNATVNQASITGESMPIEAARGTQVFAATLAQLGSLRVRARSVGRDTTFGKVIRQVEQAEANRGETQRLADRFSAWYLPLVAAIALVTYLIGGNLLAAVAVTVVACSCAFALATPVAMLASIGAAAKRGLLIKGGKYIEALARADVLLLDKTGTLTRGEPELTDVVPFGSRCEEELLALAAAAERDSEHPLAEAVRRSARQRGLAVATPGTFEAIPGRGVRARVEGRTVEVGSHRLLPDGVVPPEARELEERGRTLLFVIIDGQPAGVLAAADALRPEVPDALQSVRSLGIGQVELLTGDNERTARAIADELGITYRANLLPEDKIERVREHQAQGRTVVMIGDGVNDAPALVQANVGIAMGAAGTDIALEAAHVALMNDDWSRIPELFANARRTMGVVKLNIGFTAVYNLIGISLAAVGLLPPIFAAALQSIPDLGIMGNSARLLHNRQPTTSRPGAAYSASTLRAAPRS